MVWVWKNDYEIVSMSTLVIIPAFIHCESHRLDDAPGNEISNILVKVGQVTYPRPSPR